MARRFIALSTLCFLFLLNAEVDAQRGRPFQQLLRFTGHGWGAGYHVCNPGHDGGYYSPWRVQEDFQEWEEIKDFLGEALPTQPVVQSAPTVDAKKPLEFHKLTEMVGRGSHDGSRWIAPGVGNSQPGSNSRARPRSLWPAPSPRQASAQQTKVPAHRK